MQQLFEAIIIDKANHSAVLMRRLFSTNTSAMRWAKAQETALRLALRDTGETDDAYVNAVVGEVYPRDYDPS